MGVTVNVNGMSLCHKGSSGIAIATIPDVCKTPSPGGPIPIPYPDIAKSGDLASGTTTVKVDGGNSAAIQGCKFSTSNGDQAGSAGGVVSSKTAGEAEFIMFSPTVQMDGKSCCRLMDPMTMNAKNTVCMAGVLQAPVIAVGQLSSKKGEDKKCVIDKLKLSSTSSYSYEAYRDREDKNEQRGFVLENPKKTAARTKNTIQVLAGSEAASSGEIEIEIGGSCDHGGNCPLFKVTGGEVNHVSKGKKEKVSVFGRRRGTIFNQGKDGEYVHYHPKSRPILQKNEKYMPEVEELQSRLCEIGHSLKRDGFFGKGTERVVKGFQQSKGLGNDGIVTAKFWDKLIEEVDKKRKEKSDKTFKATKEKIQLHYFTTEGLLPSNIKPVVYSVRPSPCHATDSPLGATIEAFTPMFWKGGMKLAFKKNKDTGALEPEWECSIKYKYDNAEYEISAQLIGADTPPNPTDNMGIGELIQSAIDAMKGLKKLDEIATMFAVKPDKIPTGFPLKWDVKYPSLKLEGGFKNAEVASAYNVETVGSFKFSADPILGLEAKLDLVEFIIIAVAGPIGQALVIIKRKLADGVKVGSIAKIKAEIYIELRALGKIGGSFEGKFSASTKKLTGSIEGMIGIEVEGKIGVSGDIFNVLSADISGSAGLKGASSDPFYDNKVGVKLKFVAEIKNGEPDCWGEAGHSGAQLYYVFHMSVGVGSTDSDSNSTGQAKSGGFWDWVKSKVKGKKTVEKEGSWVFWDPKRRIWGKGK